MVWDIIEEKTKEDAMDFKELNYVLAIARHQNITKAAEALHLTHTWKMTKTNNGGK